jgi:polyisoprenoid-binding protein YceI
MSTGQTIYTISPSSDSTLAVEIRKTGLLGKRKHILFFEKFEGHLAYSAERPETSCVNMSANAESLVCRDTWLKPKKQKQVSQYARYQALKASTHPELTFSSSRITRKPLRGFAVEGLLEICGAGRTVKINVVLNQAKANSFQIDGDSTFRMSDFGIARPSRLWGLIGTHDEVVVHALLWAIRSE